MEFAQLAQQRGSGQQIAQAEVMGTKALRQAPGPAVAPVMVTQRAGAAAVAGGVDHDHGATVELGEKVDAGSPSIEQRDAGRHRLFGQSAQGVDAGSLVPHQNVADPDDQHPR
ncbi:MAG TPA: hypothetical protein VHC86_13005 [Opitutaceae bacterium]|nr:hypothetical protein [Opitutaceae bacterium]